MQKLHSSISIILQFATLIKMDTLGREATFSEMFCLPFVSRGFFKMKRISSFRANSN